MKKHILITLLALCCQMTYAEKAIIDHIVYDLDLNKLTATVLNFQTSTEDVCTVTIPSTVEYKHDTYTVTSLRYDKLDQSYEFYYKYDKARINIEHLYLPSSLEEIYADAFTGMARLKELVIPKSVKLLVGMRYRNWDWSDCPILGRYNEEEYPRLESITVLGTPVCRRIELCGYYYLHKNYSMTECFYYDQGDRKNKRETLDQEKYNYVLKVANTIAGITSLENPKSSVCPNLKVFSMPAAEKESRLIKQCFTEARTLCDSYNTKLKEHPYFDGSQITYKLVYKDSPSQLRKDCDSIKTAITKQFNALTKGRMESNLRKNNLPKYLELYLASHSELKPSSDSIRIEYRCEDAPKQDSLVLLFIEHNVLPLSCRERQYQQYKNLFTDKAEFDEIYNHESAGSFLAEINYRLEVRPWLDKFIDLVKTNPDAKLQGMKAAKEGSIPYRLNAYMRMFQQNYSTQAERQHLNFFENQALNTLFEYNEKIKEEYAKNGHYFSNREDFFKAYIEPDYKNRLKEIKKNK